jgi:uncharacterized protein (UPF0332 family)
MFDEGTRQRIGRYLARARRVLRTGYMVLEDGDIITAVNRAYYAVFYAANALLTTQGLERSKHSGVNRRVSPAVCQDRLDRSRVQRLLRRALGGPPEGRL